VPFIDIGAFIDGDDILDVNYLKYAISAFEKNKSIDLIVALHQANLKKKAKYYFAKICHKILHLI